MFRPIRSLIALALLAGLVWCSFKVPIGRRTFAQHVDRIGATPEAKELVDSTRSSVSPVLEDATDRMLGEYIEAPTQAPPGAAAPARTKPGTDAREPPGSRAARRVPSHGEGSVPARAGR
ncbi:MAG: hypothetical protein U0168_12770 [Nannocystaceae bacterium]